MPGDLDKPVKTPSTKELDAITSAPVDQVADKPDPNTAQELEHERLRTKIEDLRQNIKERKKYARWVFVLICVWIFLVYTLMLFDGFSLWRFKLGDTIILAAIGSTTANIIGVFLIVIRYLFPKK